MIMEITNDYYESLLDDPVDNKEEQTEENDVEITEEPILPEQPSDNNEESKQQSLETNTSDVEDDILTAYLKSNGIADPTKIQFENDEGGVDEVDFNSLSREEQLTMLRELGSSGYTDYEKDVID